MNSNIFALAELKQQAMNEATYYGKNEKLLELEKQFSIIQKEVFKNPVKFSTSKIVSDAFSRSETIIKDLFGFEEVFFNRSGLTNALNILMDIKMKRFGSDFAGCTLCQSYLFKTVKNGTRDGMVEVIPVGKNRKTVRIKDGKFFNFSMLIGAGFFADHGEYTLTPAEIVAVVLHEIGHNFYYAPIREGITEFSKYIGLVPMEVLMNMLVANSQLILIRIADDFLASKFGKIFRAIMNFVSGIESFLTTNFGIIQAGYDIFLGIRNLLFLPFMLIQSAIEFPRTVLTSDSEKYADAFATSFGYGADLISALRKMDSAAYDPSKNRTILNAIVENARLLTNLYMPLVMLIADCHGTSTAREYNVMRYMKEAEDHIDPALMKAYRADISRIYDNRNATAASMEPSLRIVFQRLEMGLQNVTGMSSYFDIFTTLGSGRGKYNNLDYK